MLKVNWQLGNVCTYTCSYCSKSCHDGTFPWPDVNSAIATVRALDRIYKSEPYKKEKIVFELLGGEVTVWREIDRLLDVIKETDNLCMLVTNGSRSLNWWKANAHKFGYTTLSFHPEKADYKHVTEVANILNDAGVGVGILVLMYPPLWDYCLEAHKDFVKNSRAQIITTQPLTLIASSAAAQNMSIATYDRWPYTAEQKAWLETARTYESKIPIKDAAWLYVAVKYFGGDDESTGQHIEPAYLSAHGLNNWKDWDCYVGIDTLFLEQNGHIRRDAMCYVTPPIGNWKSDCLDALSWPTAPVKCPFSACYCAHDFRARKRKSLVHSPRND